MYQTRCKYFSGYKPCNKNPTCNESCPSKEIPENQILIIHLEAIGAVLRSTALLPAIKRKYPSSMITWVTKAPAHHILKHNPFIDRILTTHSEDLLLMKSLKFDYGYVIDKDLRSTSIAQQARIKNIFGFMSDSFNGAIIPANKSVIEMWELGLDNHKKFFVNQKTETQLNCEALDLVYKRDEYQVFFTKQEELEIKARRKLWKSVDKKIVIGINTGCSPKMSARKLSASGHKKLISGLQKKFSNKIQIVLLGGPSETSLNQSLSSQNILNSPTNGGLRDGLVSVAACDIVISGDSLGMHIGIALKKWVIAWFGPTCYQEIDLFDRGIKIQTSAPCSPCWKRDCQKSKMCYDLVSFDDFLYGVEKGIQWYKKSLSSKPHFSGISSSPYL